MRDRPPFFVPILATRAGPDSCRLNTFPAHLPSPGTCPRIEVEEERGPPDLLGRFTLI
jgi:hypothetical protein